MGHKLASHKIVQGNLDFARAEYMGISLIGYTIGPKVSRYIHNFKRASVVPKKPTRLRLTHLLIRLFYHVVIRRRRSFKRVRKLIGKLVPVAETLSGENHLSDGEFIVALEEVLSDGCNASPHAIESYKHYLCEDADRRMELAQRLIFEHIARQATMEQRSEPPCQILGTSKFLTQKIWDERAEKVKRLALPAKKIATPLDERAFCHSGQYTVSAIASLYKGRRHLEAFLNNIVAQSIFDHCELIIIDANSPEGEGDLIRKYQKVYPNIIYKRMNYRIGIYDAWNEGVCLARGRYLTNTNLDDLRRADSLEIQSRTLDEHPFADVTYQDFYYSFDSALDFTEVAAFGFKSDLPILTPNNLLCFNSPHNAPMWRASLHAEVGLFDISFKSAGDWEFWLRCVAAGKKFYKVNDPHVVYYRNPEGISTSPETTGLAEGKRVLKLYSRKLVSPYLLMSRSELAATLKVPPHWAFKTSTFDVVHHTLKSIEGRF